MVRPCPGDARREPASPRPRSAGRASTRHGVPSRDTGSLGSPASNKPRTMTGIVAADETFMLELFKGRRSDLPRWPRKRGDKAKHPGLSSKTFLSSSPATARARLSTPCCRMSTAPPSRRRSLGSSPPPTSFSTAKRPSSPRPQREHLGTSYPRPASPAPRRRDHINNVNAYQGRLRNGCVASMASPPRTCPTTLDGHEPGSVGWKPALKLDPRRDRHKAYQQQTP